MKSIKALNMNGVYNLLSIFDTIGYDKRLKALKKALTNKNRVQLEMFCSIMLMDLKIPTIRLRMNTIKCGGNLLRTVGWLLYYALNEDKVNFTKLFTSQGYQIQRFLHYIFYPKVHNIIKVEDLLDILPTLYNTQELLEALPTPAVFNLQKESVFMSKEVVLPAYLLPLKQSGVNKLYYMIKRGNTIKSNDRAVVHNVKLLDKYGFGDYGVIFAVGKYYKGMKFTELCYGTPEQIEKLVTGEQTDITDLKVNSKTFVTSKSDLENAMVVHKKNVYCYLLHQTGISKVKVKYRKASYKVIDVVLNGNFEVTGVIIYIDNEPYTVNIRQKMVTPPKKIKVLVGRLDTKPLFVNFIKDLS